MRLILTASFVSLALMTAGCNNTADDTAEANTADDLAMNDMAVDDESMAGGDTSATPLTAAAFSAMIAGGNLYEIEAGKLAAMKAVNEPCRKMGTMLVTDHTKQQEMLKAAAAASDPAVTVPTAVPPEHQAHLDALKAATGAEFDRLFLAQQREAHTKMLAALKSYAETGDSPSLKAFATKAAPGVEKHLSSVTSMKM